MNDRQSGSQSSGMTDVHCRLQYKPKQPHSLAKCRTLACSLLAHCTASIDAGLPPGTSPFAGMPPQSPSTSQRHHQASSSGGQSPTSNTQLQSSPFSQPLNMERKPSLGFMSMFSGQLTPADLQKFQSSGGLSLSGFPSIPGPLPSGDLEQLLSQHQGGDAYGGQHHTPFGNMSRIPSLGIGKLESMELPGALPDNMAAMLHDLNPDHAHTAANRANSGLESMQSIEEALGNVQNEQIDKGIDAWQQAAVQKAQ